MSQKASFESNRSLICRQNYQIFLDKVPGSSARASLLCLFRGEKLANLISLSGPSRQDCPSVRLHAFTSVRPSVRLSGVFIPRNPWKRNWELIVFQFDGWETLLSGGSWLPVLFISPLSRCSRGFHIVSSL